MAGRSAGSGKGRAAPRTAPARKVPPRKARGQAKIDTTTLDGHLRARLDPLSDAVLAFPLFLTYQLGLLVSGSGGSGVDFITRGLAVLSQYDLRTYLLLLAGMFAVYFGILAWLRRRGGFDPRRFAPMLLESAVYALLMGALILAVLRRFVDSLPELSTSPGSSVGGPLEIVVISAGAGFHEELLFRLIGLSGLAWLFRQGVGPRVAWVSALILSSLLFAAAHHIGPGSEAMAPAAFAYRSLAGLYFAAIYALRGFAVAAWTHALYDVYVLSFSP